MKPTPLPMLLGQVLAIVAGGALLGCIGNAVSPMGVQWSAPLGDDLSARAVLSRVTPVKLEELKAALRTDSVLLLDARSRKSYLSGHLPGAKSMPLSDALAGTRIELPPPRSGERIITYCANEFCDAGLLLSRWLIDSGREHVGLFVEGIDVWMDEGEPLER